MEGESALGMGSFTSRGPWGPGEPQTNAAALKCQEHDGILTIKGSRDEMVIRACDLQWDSTLAS